MLCRSVRTLPLMVADDGISEVVDRFKVVWKNELGYKDGVLYGELASEFPELLVIKRKRALLSASCIRRVQIKHSICCIGVYLIVSMDEKELVDTAASKCSYLSQNSISRLEAVISARSGSCIGREVRCCK